MNLDPGSLSLIVIGVMLLLFILGIPIAFVFLLLAGIGFWILVGPDSLVSMATVVFRTLTRDIFVALPSFIFMAVLLEMSGVASALYEMMHKWFAGLRGGLAIGTVAISTIMAAMTGSPATATVTMGLLAYPEMESRGYDKKMIIGVIPAGGTLGPLIPPSIVMIIVAATASVSIGKLFIAGIIPGLIAALGYSGYVGIRCWLNPKMGPPVPKEERATWGEKLKILRLAALPIILIFMVLGLIYMGVCTPAEAGGVGAVGALMCAAINRRLNLKNLHQAARTGFRITAMLMWLLATGAAFSQLIGVIGVQDYVRELLLGLEVNRWVLLIILLGTVYLLGMFIDAVPIIIILLPIFWPIVVALDFNLMWFCLLFTIDLLCGNITPPFGMTLFYFKGLNIPNVSMMDIYRSILPYAMILTAVLILITAFPVLGTWLPGQMIK